MKKIRFVRSYFLYEWLFPPYSLPLHSLLNKLIRDISS